MSFFEFFAKMIFLVSLFLYTSGYLPIISIGSLPLYAFWVIDTIIILSFSVHRQKENPFLIGKALLRGVASIALIFGGLKIDNVIDWEWYQVLWICIVFMIICILLLAMVIFVAFNKIFKQRDANRGEEFLGDFGTYIWLTNIFMGAISIQMYMVIDFGRSLNKDFNN